MASLAQRFVFGLGGTNTVNVKLQYRLTLQLGDVDLLFANAAGTTAGRKERLQVIGLLPYPLDHPEADACFQFVWNRFVKVALAPNPAVPLNDGQADTALKTAIVDYLVDGAALPAAGQFARIRVPGDFRVLHRDFDKKYFKEPEFTLGRGTPFEVEDRFYAANPALGKIPLVALVEKKKKSDPATAWAPAANVPVYFQLLKPDTLPTFQASAAVVKRVAGANTWISGVGAAPLRAATGVKNKNVRPSRRKQPGPGGYLDRHVYKRDDTNFPKPKKDDPQARNTWFELGGKRAMSALGDVITRPVAAKPNVFDDGNIGTFYTIYSKPADVPAVDKKKNANAVCATTNANGEAGVIFAPSRVGGDRYRLRAYVGAKQRKAKQKTGTMVRWRTVRLSRNITVGPPATGAGLDNKLQQEFIRHAASCGHAAKNGGRYCAKCMLREGDVPQLQFGDYLTREFSKAYCEFLVDVNADKPAHLAITATDLADAVQALQDDQASGKQLGGVVSYTQAIGRTDGIMSQFTATLPFGESALRKNIKVIIGDRVVAIDDGAGNFVGSGANMDIIHREGVTVGGTVDYSTGALNLTLNKIPPPNKEVKVRYTLRAAINWTKLVYHSNQSPFMLNLHSVQRYNSRINRTKFAPIPAQQEVTAQALPSASAARDRFTANVGSGLSKVTVKLNNAVPPDGSLFVMTNELTGQIEVVPISAAAETFAYNHLYNGDTRLCQLSAKAEPAGTPELLSVKLKLQDNSVKEVGFVRSFDSQFMVTGTDAIAQGVSVIYDPSAPSLRVRFPAPQPSLKEVTVSFKRATALPATDTLTYDCTLERIYDDTNPAPATSPPPRPSQSLLVQVSRIISWYLMAKLIRAVEHNDGYMPGLMLLRSPLRDTWTAVWDSKGLHEGKGMCNGFFLFFGNMWVANGYDAAFEAAEASTSSPERYEPLVLHEMSHCLYLNHFPSGANISGARPDQHDAFDACIMGYGDHNRDLCGQCTARYMGLNSRDRRMITWKGPEMMGPSLWTNPAEEASDPTKYVLRHVEPPEIAAPEPYRSSDDVYSMLLDCPIGKRVYQDAMHSMGWQFRGGGLADPLGAEGLIAMKLDPKGGRGSCDPLPGEVGFTCVDRVALKLTDVAHAAATVTTTALGQRVQNMEGNDIAVQILIMELSNLLHRYDFFALDTRAYRGEVGLMDYVRRTERIEYDGGVTNVIAAFAACHANWNARICTKQEASHCTSFNNYYDNVLVAEHKDKYFGSWHVGMMKPFYLRKLPNLRSFSYTRLDTLMTLVKKQFGYESYGKKDNFELYEDDDAVWTLLRRMFTVDPNWDLDATNKVLNWARGILGSRPATDTAMQKVQAVVTALPPP